MAQKEIVTLETELQKIDPKTTISSFGTTQSVDASASASLVDFTRKFFNAKLAIERIAKAEFADYANPPSVGQAVGVWMACEGNKE